jgi:REP element-mobilizing transposase RayT
VRISIPAQLELPRRGGPRPGSGRRPGLHPHIRHRSRGAIRAAHPGLVTLKVRADVPALRVRRFVDAFEEVLRALAARRDFRVVQYSVQKNHAHFVVEADGAQALGAGMKALAARFARAANRAFARSGPVLTDRYHLRVLRTPREVRNAIAYVLQNVRKHLAQVGARLPRRGLVDSASSGRWFSGWCEALPRAHDPPAVAAPRSWLLRVGWRRWGLLALDEVPGGFAR